MRSALVARGACRRGVESHGKREWRLSGSEDLSRLAIAAASAAEQQRRLSIGEAPDRDLADSVG